MLFLQITRLSSDLKTRHLLRVAVDPKTERRSTSSLNELAPLFAMSTPQSAAVGKEKQVATPASTAGTRKQSNAVFHRITKPIQCRRSQVPRQVARRRRRQQQLLQRHKPTLPPLPPSTTRSRVSSTSAHLPQHLLPRKKSRHRKLRLLGSETSEWIVLS